jgi:UDP-3-O-[3-hydroxymyristoyl] glucosamine N-acyltransferase
VSTLAELSRAVDGELQGAGDVEITGVASLESAGPRDIAAVAAERFIKLARETQAGALLVSTEVAVDFDRPSIRSEFALVALNRVMHLLGLIPPPPAAGVHPSAVVDATAQVDPDAHIGPLVVVGPGARIGARSVLHPGVVVERGVEMGEGCVIEPGAVLHEGCVLGHRVHIGAHSVLSRQGFGFALGPEGPVHLHHLGRVVIEDDAHIGAGCTIDRARFDETRLGRFSALDNLVHIAHNCHIGVGTFIAAFTGLAGNCRIGDRCEIGGQVGMANRGGVGNRCRVGAQAGVTKAHGDDVDLWGTPAIEKNEYMRQLAAMRRLARS